MALRIRVNALLLRSGPNIAAILLEVAAAGLNHQPVPVIHHVDGAKISRIGQLAQVGVVHQNGQIAVDGAVDVDDGADERYGQPFSQWIK